MKKKTPIIFHCANVFLFYVWEQFMVCDCVSFVSRYFFLTFDGCVLKWAEEEQLRTIFYLNEMQNWPNKNGKQH